MNCAAGAQLVARGFSLVLRRVEVFRWAARLGLLLLPFRVVADAAGASTSIVGSAVSTAGSMTALGLAPSFRTSDSAVDSCAVAGKATVSLESQKSVLAVASACMGSA